MRIAGGSGEIITRASGQIIPAIRGDPSPSPLRCLRISCLSFAVLFASFSLSLSFSCFSSAQGYRATTPMSAFIYVQWRGGLLERKGRYDLSERGDKRRERENKYKMHANTHLRICICACAYVCDAKKESKIEEKR